MSRRPRQFHLIVLMLMTTTLLLSAFAALQVSGAALLDSATTPQAASTQVVALTQYPFSDLPVLGQVLADTIHLGGFSGLYFEGQDAENHLLHFVTHTDRGPNGETTDYLPATAGKERPFALPDFIPEMVRFVVNTSTGEVTITERISLKRSDGVTPITGLPNLVGADGMAYDDENPIDPSGNLLPYDPYGADPEGIVKTPDGTYWLVDEYRPAIYNFTADGTLIERYVPMGSNATTNTGIEAFPAVYAQRRANRGFEGVAYYAGKLYAFIQSPLDNPDAPNDSNSKGSSVMRILEFDVATKTTTGEYLYIKTISDKLGDAVSVGGGEFLVIERDDLADITAKKAIYRISLAGATNVLGRPERLEQMTVAQLAAAGIRPVSKRLQVDMPAAGYIGFEKVEGLTFIAPNTLAVINDNDFGLSGDVLPLDGSIRMNPNAATPTLVLMELQPYDLTLLHTNDFHGRVDGAGGFGGSARIASKSQEIRAAETNVLLLDAGDQFQGSLFYRLFKADIVTATMNALNYDAMTIGNHEFDDGPSQLARLIAGAEFPIVCSNIDVSAEPLLAGKILSSAVITMSGEPIGIVGAITPETSNISSPGPNVVFLDPVAGLQTAADALAAQGINKIIALTHLGYGEDVQVAGAVHGLDVIVGGHSHTFLYSGAPPSTETAAGPYPTIVQDTHGDPVLVVTAFQWGKYLGRLDVTFTFTGAVSASAGNPILLDNTVAPDATVDALLAPYRTSVNELMQQVIGDSLVEMPVTVGGQQICRVGECVMGNFVAEAMLWKANQANPLMRYDIAIQNGGGLRAAINAGTVTVGEVLEVLPFGNTIATMHITGTHIIAALESGVSRVGQASGTGRFPQVAGMRFTWDPGRPVGSRVLSVEVETPSGFRPLDPNAVYGVVTNNFMRGGGDGYTMFRDFAINPYDAGAPQETAVMDYIQAFSPVAPHIEGRIKVWPLMRFFPLVLHLGR